MFRGTPQPEIIDGMIHKRKQSAKGKRKRTQGEKDKNCDDVRDLLILSILRKKTIKV